MQYCIRKRPPGGLSFEPVTIWERHILSRENSEIKAQRQAHLWLLKNQPKARIPEGESTGERREGKVWR